MTRKDIVHIGVDKEKPGTWPRYRKGLCDQCRATCCTMPLEVKAADLVRLGLILEEEADDPPKKIASRLKKVIEDVRVKQGIFVIARKGGGDCIYLDSNRRCTVYDRRPDVCRGFPEKLGSRVGYCPYSPKSAAKVSR